MNYTIASIEKWQNGNYGITFANFKKASLDKKGNVRRDQDGTVHIVKLFVSPKLLVKLADKAGFEVATAASARTKLTGAIISGLQYQERGAKYKDQDGNEQERETNGFAPVRLSKITVTPTEQALQRFDNAESYASLMSTASVSTAENVNFDEEETFDEVDEEKVDEEEEIEIEEKSTKKRS